MEGTEVRVLEARWSGAGSGQERPACERMSAGVLIGWGVGGGLMREGRRRGTRSHAFGRVLEGEADQIVGGAALHDVGCGFAD